MLIGNLIKNQDDYCILLLMDGQWRDVGIVCGSFVEAMDIADRTLDQLYVNLPVNEGFDENFSQAA
jgi:hypothetical protein